MGIWRWRKRVIALSLKSFVEKPDNATAEKYLAAGNYYWNSGMFYRWSYGENLASHAGKFGLRRHLLRLMRKRSHPF